jgi:nitrite reductase/ring-hydroxylating ferredoxin subunit
MVCVGTASGTIPPLDPQLLAMKGSLCLTLPALADRIADPAEHDIALFDLGGTLYASEDSCPHQGASLFGGKLSGRLIKCRAHGLRFDLATGCMPGVTEFPVRTCATEREDERLFIAAGERFLDAVANPPQFPARLHPPRSTTTCTSTPGLRHGAQSPPGARPQLGADRLSPRPGAGVPGIAGQLKSRGVRCRLRTALRENRK